MKRTRRIYAPTTALALAAVLMLFTGPANASGFRVPESSIAGLGTANALVANPEELGALVYNPAAMAFQKGNNIVAGVVVIEPDTNVTNTAGTSESDPDSPFFVPNLYFMTHFGDPWTFGLNISSPFGLETNWPAGAFPNFGPLAATQPTRSRIEMVNINPNFAYAFNDTISAAFGVDYYQVNKANLDSVAATVNGSGADWGWNAAVLYSKGRWSAGASYRSSVEVKIDGVADLRSLGSFAFGAELEIEFPDMLQIGARYKATDKLGIEFDIERTKWSTFDTLVITATSVAPPGSPPLSSNVNNWDDVNAYRLGFTYQLSSKTQLRFGYTFDETPQPDATFTARIPDADRQLLSFGVKQRISTWDLEAGIMYVKWDDRTISSTTAFVPAPGVDPNGTTAFDGNYDSTAILVGLGFGKSF